MTGHDPEYVGPDRRTPVGQAAVTAAISELAEEVRALRADLDLRPTRNETVYRRRRMTALLGLGIILAIFLHDEHIERCAYDGAGPVVEMFVDGVSDPAALRETARRVTPPPPVCGVTFPLHSHVPGEDWPNNRNLAGMALYIVLACATVIWMRAPKPGRGNNPPNPKEN